MKFRTESFTNQKVMLSALFAVIGIGLLVIAAVTGMAKRSFARNAARAQGVVVRLNAGGSHPEIEFADVSGQRISYPQGGLIFGYRPGDKVNVLYLPNDPRRTACLDTFGALWFVPSLLAIMGVLFVIAGVMRSLEAV